MKAADTPGKLTVLYDGACPLCQREIGYVRRLAAQGENSGLCFVDISQEAAPELSADRAALLARFHVQRADGSYLSGAAAFVEMWSRLPAWRWLARLARLPGILYLLEHAYRIFLHLRPSLQKLARRG